MKLFPYRSKHGQSAVELAAGIIVIIPIVLFGLDVACLFMGQSMNASICRDAARAAAAGPPSSISPQLTPKQRAEAVVRRTQKAEGAIRVNSEVQCSEAVTRTPTMPFGGIVEGTVTVQTSVDVYPPFILKNIVNKGAVKLTTSQTFPFTFVMASAYNNSNSESLAGGTGVPGSPQPGAAGSGSGGPLSAMSQPAFARMDAPPPPPSGK